MRWNMVLFLPPLSRTNNNPDTAWCYYSATQLVSELLSLDPPSSRNGGKEWPSYKADPEWHALKACGQFSPNSCNLSTDSV